MLTNRPVASAAQCRAARALLGWTQAQLADAAGVARKTIANFESSARPLHRRTRRDITVALEKGGIEFIGEDGLRRHALPCLISGMVGLLAFV